MVFIVIYLVGFVMSFLLLEKVFNDDLKDDSFRALTYSLVAVISFFSWGYLIAYFMYEKILKGRVK